MKLFLTLIAIVAFTLVPLFVHAKEKKESDIEETNTTEIVLANVSSKFRAYKNKVGRVSITKVEPLSINSFEKEKSFYFGLSFLTQDDVVLSPGIGSVLSF